MGNRRRDGSGSAILALSLALGGEWAVQAQDPGLSTGSGVGTGAGAGAMSSANTGTGAMTGAQRSGSGLMSGRGPGSPMDRGTALPLGPGRGAALFGPDVDVSFPTDPYLVPFLIPQVAADPAQGELARRITSRLLADARQVSDPAERSLALRQIGNGAIASNQLVLAHHTLEEAISAASKVTVPLVRDQRLIGLVVSLNALSDGLLRVAGDSRNAIAPPEEAQAAGLEALPKWPESTVLIRMARLEWRRAVYLASSIGNPTYRNEMLYRVAEDEAIGSSRIANDLPGGADIDSLGNRPASNLAAAAEGRQPVPSPSQGNAPRRLVGERPPAVQPPPPGAGRPSRTPITPRPPSPPAGSPAPAESADDAAFSKLADEILVDSWDVARKIDRLLWKNRAMVRISLSASDSRQYMRGVELARTIENAESRSEALLLLADAQCRHHQNQAATPTYQAAAEAVASIPQAGLRGVMTGFLIDSLIASGRFDDARACTIIYPEESERFVALGAIAEAQGQRGQAEAARRWIATEAPPSYRSALYRRVITGELWAVEYERSKEQPMGNETVSPRAPR